MLNQREFYWDGMSDNHDEDETERQARFSPEDQEKLVKAVAEQAHQQINWEQISALAFDAKYSAKQCVFEFLRLPITESLFLDFETRLSEKDSAENEFAQ